MASKPRTLYEKIWDQHVIEQRPDGTCLIFIDRHLVHEVTSPQAFEGLRLAGRKPWRVESIVATAGLIVATSTAALVVGELEFFRAFGPALALTAAISLLVSITFVPASLALFGRLVFWPSLRPGDGDPEDGEAPLPVRSRIAQILTSRPLAAVVGSTVWVLYDDDETLGARYPRDSNSRTDRPAAFDHPPRRPRCPLPNRKPCTEPSGSWLPARPCGRASIGFSRPRWAR